MAIEQQSSEYRGGGKPVSEPIDRLDRIRRILVIRTGGAHPVQRPVAPGG
jgi:hypothetical protein